VLIVLIAFLVRVRVGESRLAGIEHPERALSLIVGRSMDAQVALERAPAWERRGYALLLSDAGSEIGQAITWYEELANESLAPGVDLSLAVLLGEAGRRERLQRAVGAWTARGEPLSTYAGVITAAYLGGDALDHDAVHETLAELGPGWFADVLTLRVAPRLDEPSLADDARQALADRSRPLLWRVRAIAVLDLALLVLAVWALRAMWRWRRRLAFPRVADAPLPPPWSLSGGLETLIRGGALAAVMFVLLIFGSDWLVEQPLLAEAVDQPLMYVPLLLLVWRVLLAPAGLGFVAAFGLRPRSDGWRVWLVAAVMLIGAGITIDLGLTLIGDRLGLSSHWTEWFDAQMAWGSPSAVAMSLLGSVVFAPVFEELIFRGLLYGTLRTRLAWPVAATGSALVFAVAHGYGAAGFVSVLLSGVLWAWVYERTGSLLPSMAAHVANNLAVALTLAAMLR
jgi:uncharacterized protein